jgi:tetratricopeptide (TPR) repeat protein
VQKGRAQLQAGTPDLALASGEAAIKMNAERWEGYALAGGALMNLKCYEDAADKFSHAIDRAPEAKQAALRDLRKQCVLAESGAAPVAKESAPAATTTQAEIVLWKSIENSQRQSDFEAYLQQYPNGAFSALAKSRLQELPRGLPPQAKTQGQTTVRNRTFSNAKGNRQATVFYVLFGGEPALQLYGVGGGVSFKYYQLSITPTRIAVGEIQITAEVKTVLNDRRQDVKYEVSENFIKLSDARQTITFHFASDKEFARFSPPGLKSFLESAMNDFPATVSAMGAP